MRLTSVLRIEKSCHLQLKLASKFEWHSQAQRTSIHSFPYRNEWMDVQSIAQICIVCSLWPFLAHINHGRRIRRKRVLLPVAVAGIYLETVVMEQGFGLLRKHVAQGNTVR